MERVGRTPKKGTRIEIQSPFKSYENRVEYIYSCLFLGDVTAVSLNKLSGNEYYRKRCQINICEKNDVGMDNAISLFMLQLYYKHFI